MTQLCQNRRTFLASAGALTLTSAAGVALACPAPAPVGGQHVVLMLSRGCGDKRSTNVFEPPILRIEPGDTVSFVAEQRGHNAASMKDMIPAGAEPWKGKINQEIAVTLTQPGVYGYVCTPHYGLGMVGVIVVGGDLSNLADLRSVRHRGRAKKAFAALLDEVETTA